MQLEVFFKLLQKAGGEGSVRISEGSLIMYTSIEAFTPFLYQSKKKSKYT